MEKNIEWVNPIVDLLIPQRATLFGWCVLLPALYLVCGGSAMRTNAAFGRVWPLLVLPLPLLHTHSALALVLLCLVGGVYTLVCRARGERRAALAWGWFAVCGVVWLARNAADGAGAERSTGSTYCGCT